MDAPPRRVTVEIEPGSEPISGRIRDDNGSRPFSGWLQLALAIEAASEGEPESSEPDQTSA